MLAPGATWVRVWTPVGGAPAAGVYVVAVVRASEGPFGAVEPGVLVTATARPYES
jgi:hypothetical protein